MRSSRAVVTLVLGLLAACTPLERHLREDVTIDAADARDDAVEASFDAGATDLATTDVIATDQGVTDQGVTDQGVTDQGVTDAPTMDIPTTDVTVTDTPTTDIPTTDIPTTDIPADIRPTCPAGMVTIPEGRFLMGDPAGLAPAATPVHGVRLTAYCMDLTEVTVAAYRGCTAAGCTAPDTAAGCNWGVAGRDDHPINCITGEQADAYCRWRGGVLPTEAQWEYAARGPDNRTYPWGNEAPGARPCWSGGGTARAGTCPVATSPADVSAAGLLDMAGDVMEWTSDGFAGYTGDASAYVTNPRGPAPNAMTGVLRMMRGSHWRVTDPTQLESVARIGGESRGYSVVGVRCARSLE